MFEVDLSVWLALFNGFLSFFNPCVLPLLPLYFSYLAGTTIDNIKDNKALRMKMLINSIAFVLGLSFLNIMYGFGAKTISSFLKQYNDSIRIFGGIIIIIFGLYFMGVFKIKLFDRERKFQYKNYSPSFLKSLILGFIFSFGWTPCNAPILSNILLLASFEKNYMQAGGLMLIYSLGFAIPFLVSAIFINLFLQNYKKVYKHFNIIKIVAGLLMIAMGILLLTDNLSILII